MQRIILWLTLVLRVITGVQHGPDSRGREFIISFIENEGNQGSHWKFVDLFIGTASLAKVFVNVSAPRYPAAKLHENFCITIGKVEHLKLNYNVVNTGSKRSPKGIHITATDEIIVFSINRQSTSTDGFLAFPTDVLGTTHYAVCFSYDSNKVFTSNLVVVGTEDNTKLAIQLSRNHKVKVIFEGNTYIHDQWINITLNAYETLQLRTFGDLTGSFIQGDKPIAVLTGNKKTDLHVHEGSYGDIDHVVEQIPPTLTWGKHFVTFPFPGRTDGYVLRFVTSEDHTNISIAGCVTETFILNKRSFRQENIPNSRCFLTINSSKPILIAQFSKSSDGKILSDPSMFIVPPIEQYAADYVISSPPATNTPFTNYFMVIIKASEKDDLIVDGKNIQSVRASFKPIHGTDLVGGYVYVGKDTKAHSIKHKSPTSVFGAVAYGGANYESYSFPLGLRLAPINQVCKNSRMKLADGLDNDCDELVDEEICNGKDDDGDLNIDEDCAASDPKFTTSQTSIGVQQATTDTVVSTASSQTSTLDSSTGHKKSTRYPITATFPIGYPTQGSVNKYFQGNQHLSGSKKGKGRTIWVLPKWLKVLAAMILASVCCVILGLSLCLCKKVCGLVKRRNGDDEEEKCSTLWQKKKRPLPFQRKH